MIYSGVATRFHKELRNWVNSAEVSGTVDLFGRCEIVIEVYCDV